MIDRDDTSFSDFARRQREHWRPDSGTGRALAAVATLLLFALLLMADRIAAVISPSPIIYPVWIAADRPAVSKPLPPPDLPFLAHMIRPKAEDAAMPQFDIQQPVVAPRPLSATASTAPSPLAGSLIPNATPKIGAAASSLTGGNGNAGATAGCLDADWVHAVRAHLLDAFHYPSRARALGLTGEVHLRFTVERDGFFSTYWMEKSSGSMILDSRSLDMMKAAQPLPPIPARMHVAHVNGILVLLFGQQYSGAAPPLLTCD